MMQDEDASRTVGDALEAPLAPHTRVAVRCYYDGSWTDGFEIAEVDPAAAAPYVLRRRSDGVRLPVRFALKELRPA